MESNHKKYLIIYQKMIDLKSFSGIEFVIKTNNLFYDLAYVSLEIGSIITDTYAMARIFRYDLSDSKEVYIYAGDAHSKHFR